MAVNGLCGDLGNGKTLSAVEFAIQHWIKGGTVVSNISFFWEPIKEHCRKVHGVELQDRQLKQIDAAKVREFHRHTLKGTEQMPVYLMIDECARNWDSKAWNRDLDLKLEQSDFLRNSRKLFNEVFLIVQKEDRLDKSFRELWEFRYTFRRIKWLPFLNRFILQCKEHNDTGVRVSTKWWPIDKRLYPLYDSYATYTNHSVDDLETAEPVALPTPKKEIPVMLRIAMLVALVYAGWLVISHLTKGVGKGAVPVPAVASAVPSPRASLPSPVASAPSEKEKPAGPRAYIETFRGFFANVLRTDGGEYVNGQLSRLGRVMSVSPQGAQIWGFDGVPVLVVAQQSRPSSAKESATVTPKTQPAQTGVFASGEVLAWSPTGFPLDASLAMPPRVVKVQFIAGVKLR